MSEEVKDALALPEVEIATRILIIKYIIDISGSMKGTNIGIVNQTLREQFPVIATIMDNNPEIEIKIQVIVFSDKAKWEIGPEPVNPKEINWNNLHAGGRTSMGKAVEIARQSIERQAMPKRGLPPLMVLLSDGINTDGRAYDKAIDALNTEPWGMKAVRLAIGIGEGYDIRQLERFCNQPEIGVLEAANAADLEKYIRFASTQVSRNIAEQRSNPNKTNGSNVSISPLMEAEPLDNAKLVVL